MPQSMQDVASLILQTYQVATKVRRDKQCDAYAIDDAFCSVICELEEILRQMLMKRGCPPEQITVFEMTTLFQSHELCNEMYPKSIQDIDSAIEAWQI